MMQYSLVGNGPLRARSSATSTTVKRLLSHMFVVVVFTCDETSDVNGVAHLTILPQMIGSHLTMHLSLQKKALDHRKGFQISSTVSNMLPSIALSRKRVAYRPRPIVLSQTPKIPRYRSEIVQRKTVSVRSYFRRTNVIDIVF
jgi:hypothetical protein